ncbi:MAG: class I SAM-dependent methyltransferase [Rhodobacteraceae bacterium]|nr:class I SAM-dependent methyltransferase [Paracoccaceae bacterium]
MTARSADRAELGPFLATNPFPGKLTDGLYFRDKMRAIHRIAPESVAGPVLEVGGGQSGLTKLLYPEAEVTNLDFDPQFASAPCNRQPGQEFVAGDATSMPFDDDSFRMVTMFDLLEHVENDVAVARETLRVLKPGGTILVSTPDLERWRYPYYRLFRPICPEEETLFAEWGHVRRGYTQEQLDQLFGQPASAFGAFINPWLAVSHDIAFSRIPKIPRQVAHLVVAPISLIGWFSHKPDSPGTEIAARWDV